MSSVRSCARGSADPAEPAWEVQHEPVLIHVELDRVVAVLERPAMCVEPYVSVHCRSDLERIDVDGHHGEFGTVTDVQR